MERKSSKYRHGPKRKAFPVTDRTSIHQRPEEANGKRFGDFEIDLIVDRYNHVILTLVERFTNMQAHQAVYPKASKLR